MTPQQQLVDGVEQSGGYVNRIFWVAGQLESSEFEDILDDLSPQDLKGLFPKTKVSEMGNWDDFMQFVYSNNKLGFIAQCYFPHHDNFRFEKGKKEPVSWSVHMGMSSVRWVYADTLEEIVVKMTKIGKSLHRAAWMKQLEKGKKTK